MPWQLPWSLDALQAALLWEIAWACTENEQLRPDAGVEALDRVRAWASADLDEVLGRAAHRIVEAFARDLSRVWPPPQVTLVAPGPLDEDSSQALTALAARAHLELGHEVPPALDEPAAARAARRLTGAIGLIDEELRACLRIAAREAGDPVLAEALDRLLADGGDLPHVDQAASTDDGGELDDLLDHLRRHWPRDRGSGVLGLDLATVAGDLWFDVDATVDWQRRQLHRLRRSRPNTRLVQLAIERHVLRCRPPDPRLVAHLDFVEATLWNERKRPDLAIALLAPHVESPPSEQELAGHIEGLAGRAAALTGRPELALALYQRNLERLPSIFKLASPAHLSAQADVEHKMGQLLREHPELPGGAARAQALLESSLALHLRIGKIPGVSMCLCELGKLALAADDTASARAYFGRALESDRAADNRAGLPVVLHGLALVHLHAGDLDEALRCIEEVEALHRAAPHVSPAQREQVRNTRDRIEHELGSQRVGTLEELLLRLAEMDGGDQRGLSTFLRQNAGWLRDAGRATDAEALLRAGLARSTGADSREHLTVALIGLLLEQRRHEEAATLLGSIAPAEPTLASEHGLARARLAMQQGDLDEAVRRLEALPHDSSSTTRSRALLLRGRTLLARKQPAPAAAAFRDARELAGSARAISALLEQQVRAALELGDLASAALFAGELDGHTARRPPGGARIRALALVGDVAFAEGRFDDAVRAFEHALQVVADVGSDVEARLPRLHRRAARACALGGRLDEGLSHVEDGLRHLDAETAPELRGWLYQLAAHLHRLVGDLNEFERAMEAAELAAEEADDQRLRNALAMMRAGDMRGDELVDVLLEGAAGEDVVALMTRARVLRRQRRTAEALAVLDGAESVAANGVMVARVRELRFAIALDLQEAGERTAAETRPVLEAMQADRPVEELPARSLALLARAAAIENDYDRATELAMRGYTLARSTGEFQTLARTGAILARAWSARGDTERALATYRELATYMEAHGRRQSSIDARYSLCRHLIDRHQPTAARDELRVLVEMAGDLSVADRVRVESAHAEIDVMEDAIPAAIARLRHLLVVVAEAGQPQLAPRVHRQLASLLSDIGRPVEAAEHQAQFAQASLPARLSAPTVTKILRTSGRDDDAVATARAELERAGPHATQARAVALHSLASALAQVGSLSEAETCAREALALHLDVLKKGVPGCRVTLATILYRRRRRAEAIAEVERALEENRRSNPYGVRKCEQLLARWRGEQAPLDPASAPIRDLISRAREHGLRNEYTEADRLMRIALERGRAEGDDRSTATALGHFGIRASRRRRDREAVPLLVEATAMHEALGSHLFAECAVTLAESLERLGRFDEALAYARKGGPRVADRIRDRALTLIARLEARRQPS